MRQSANSIFFTLLALCFLLLSPVFRAEAASTKDKFSLWKEPSFFRGAAIHPYNPYSETTEGASFVKKKDFTALKNQGANVVSLNYPGPYRAEPPYALDATQLKWLDDAIGWAEEVGLYVVIHFRNGPGKSEATFAGSPDGADEVLWYSQAAKDKWVEMWRFVADRYKNRAHVVAYNLMVEPHPDVPVKQPPLPASAWFDLAKSITDEIRKVDGQTPIIISAAAWSNPLGMEDAVPTGDARTIYSFHMYEPFKFTHQGFEWAGLGNVSGLVYPGMIPSEIYSETVAWDKNRLKDVVKHALAFQKKYQNPIFIGEFGCNRRVPSCIVFLDDLISVFEEYGWSYTHFLWRDGETDAPGGGGFDYETEPSGTAAVPESSYMRMFKKHWLAAGTVSPSPGSLIKLNCPIAAVTDHPCKAVYYYGADNKRHAYPNAKTYFTWYPDFSGVKPVSSETMASIPLGTNVTYHHGVKLVKITTDTKVYAVAEGGVLRWVTSEALAIALYGTNWNTKVDDIPDAFFTNYSIGADITKTSDYSPGIITATLKELAAPHGFRIGSNYDYEFRGETHDRIFEQEFSLMTSLMLWDPGSRPSRNEFDFTEMDTKVNWARTRGLDVHGHTLVWFAPSEMADWVIATPSSEIEAVMNAHIDAVVGRYAGKVALWDVVNEAVDDDGTLRQGHKWSDAMGNAYIRKAFVRAHAADPKAVLRLNEYDIESNEAKFKGIKALLIELKNQGVPVHALGWQMHMKPSSFDPATLLARMNEIADLGFDNYISELDVELPVNATATHYEQQKQTYKQVIQTFLAARRHKTLVFWGVRDGSTNWLTNGHALLFDENFKKKPAYFGVQEALK